MSATMASHFSHFARSQPGRVAAIFPDGAQSVTFAELEAAANRAANAMAALGLRRGDCIALSITNRPEWLAAVFGAQRAGVYYVPVSTKLSADDLAYIVRDSGAPVVVVSSGCFALETDGALESLPARVFGIDLAPGMAADWTALLASQPATLPEGASRGRPMLYSSGTTGRPKGIRKPLPEGSFDTPDPADLGIRAAYDVSPDSVMISPSPLYHAAPHRFVTAALHAGATAVIPASFDAAATLAAIGTYRCTHGLWVPTMFHRMLRLPEAVRAAADVSSQRFAIHGAAPCPVHVKHAMIAWWGPILDEYYSGSEGVGATRITSAEWLAHPGSVGRPADGIAHVLGPDGEELPTGATGDIYFGGNNAFEYWRDPAKTQGVVSRHGWRTFGDVGHLDADGYLYLTDRRHFTIISGGVNIYPQEIEAVLLEHEAVRDVAVIGVPSEDFGQEAKAVVELVDVGQAGPAMAAALTRHVRQRLGPVKTPKSIAFEDRLPRHDTGKLYKADLARKYAAFAQKDPSS